MACNRIRKIGIKKELIPIYNNISQHNHDNGNDKKNKNDYINLYCGECSKPIHIIAVTKALPRYRIFYSAKYDKKIGLPSKHPLHKVWVFFIISFIIYLCYCYGHDDYYCIVLLFCNIISIIILLYIYIYIL